MLEKATDNVPQPSLSEETRESRKMISPPRGHQPYKSRGMLESREDNEESSYIDELILPPSQRSVKEQAKETPKAIRTLDFGAGYAELSSQAQLLSSQAREFFSSIKSPEFFGSTKTQGFFDNMKATSPRQATPAGSATATVPKDDLAEAAAAAKPTEKEEEEEQSTPEPATSAPVPVAAAVAAGAYEDDDQEYYDILDDDAREAMLLAQPAPSDVNLGPWDCLCGDAVLPKAVQEAKQAKARRIREQEEAKGAAEEEAPRKDEEEAAQAEEEAPQAAQEAARQTEEEDRRQAEQRSEKLAEIAKEEIEPQEMQTKKESKEDNTQESGGFVVANTGTVVSDIPNITVSDVLSCGCQVPTDNSQDKQQGVVEESIEEAKERTAALESEQGEEFTAVQETTKQNQSNTPMRRRFGALFGGGALRSNSKKNAVEKEIKAAQGSESPDKHAAENAANNSKQEKEEKKQQEKEGKKKVSKAAVRARSPIRAFRAAAKEESLNAKRAAKTATKQEKEEKKKQAKEEKKKAAVAARSPSPARARAGKEEVVVMRRTSTQMELARSQGIVKDSPKLGSPLKRAREDDSKIT